MKLQNQTSLNALVVRGEPEPNLMLATVIVKVAYTFDGSGKLQRLAAGEVDILEGPQETELGLVPGDHVPYRPGVDLYVLGHAHAPGGRPTRTMTVELRIADLRREILVTGDRLWTGDGSPTPAEPFVTMPLTYARAYGGKARQDGQELAHPDNPVGRGFVLDAATAEGTALPNLEDPGDLIKSWESRPQPACWAPLPAQTGIHVRRSVEILDASSMAYRLLPQIFHVAHPDLVLPDLAPGSLVSLRGMTPGAALSIPIPSLALRLQVTLGAKTFALAPKLDTVGIHAHTKRLEATFRSSFRYRFVRKQQRVARLTLDAGSLS